VSIATALVAVSAVTNPRSVCDPSLSNSTLFDFSIKDVYQIEDMDLDQLRGKLTLVVNVATY